MTDPDGRYQLPAMDPGRHEIEIHPPAGWTRTSATPEYVEIVAGRAEGLDVELAELGTLRGAVVVVDGSGAKRAAPAGVLVATAPDGTLHETLVFGGSFTMRLPAGTYRLSFMSELPEEVGRQLTAEVVVGNTEPVTVRLEAHERARGLRKTLIPSRKSQDGGE